MIIICQNRKNGKYQKRKGMYFCKKLFACTQPKMPVQNIFAQALLSLSNLAGAPAYMYLASVVNNTFGTSGLATWSFIPASRHF